VKHGGVNATVPDKDKLDALTLDEAVGLIAAKGGKAAPSPRKPSARKSASVDVESAAEAGVAAKRAPRASTSSRATAAKKPATSRGKSTAAPAARAPKTAKTAKRSGATKSTSSTARKR
jgi:DNA topoisomerase-1